MKKIITLLFVAGCLTTAAFAQSGHSQQSNGQSNGYGQHSQQNSANNRNQYSQNSHNGNGGYAANQSSNRNQNEYGYNKQRDNRDRGDSRRNQYNYPSDHQGKFEDHSGWTWNRASGHHRIYRNDNRH